MGQSVICAEKPMMRRIAGSTLPNDLYSNERPLALIWGR